MSTDHGTGDARVSTETATERLNHLQEEVFSVLKQLEAFGFLLENQSEDLDGVPELRGLGITLTEMSRRLYEVWRRLDPADFPSS